MAASYYELQDHCRAAREARDAEFQEQAEETLREAWKGPDFKRNKNAIENMLTKWPEGLAENFLAGRMADGSRIGDNPVMAQILAQIADGLEPGRTPGAGRVHAGVARTRAAHGVDRGADGRPAFGILEGPEGQRDAGGVSRAGRRARCRQGQARKSAYAPLAG